jgi:hypothetical protein
MTPQEIVRSRYREAVAVHQGPIFVLDQKAPLREGGWVVLSAHSLGAQILGIGSTEADAWATAASTLRAQSSRPLSGFRDWLAEQAEREGSAEQRRQIIEEWKDAVAELFAQMVRWLAEEDTHQVLTVETGLTHKEEEGLGPYDIAALRINLSARFVELVPLGRNVVGGIGKKGDLGLRTEGRVDMRTRARKYVLYRVADEEGKRWVIVDDDDDTIQNLSKEAFVTALQELLS